MRSACQRRFSLQILSSSWDKPCVGRYCPSMAIKDHKTESRSSLRGRAFVPGDQHLPHKEPVEEAACCEDPEEKREPWAACLEEKRTSSAFFEEAKHLQHASIAHLPSVPG